MTDVNELLRFQRELKEEEELIITMLAKIDTQLHALQVEQLQLLNAANPLKVESPIEANSNDDDNDEPMGTNVKKELDLVVPKVWENSEDEEEEEEEEEDEQN